MISGIETGGRPRVVLAQTQAEGAGAQEIARIVGRGLTERGFDVHYLFFYRRTGAFDDIPNTFYCASTKPSGVAGVARMLVALWRQLRILRPATILTFQHYGNILGGPVARLAGLSPVIANQNTTRAQMPSWAVQVDRIFGSLPIYTSIVVNSAHTQSEYDHESERFRKKLVRIDHGFDPKLGRCSMAESRALFSLPQSKPLLGSVGRLHIDKNLAAAIRLLPIQPDWHLALAGQGPERPLLEALAQQLGVADRLHFVGELKPALLAEFLRGLDVFVFPTLLETFGLAAVEAAQSGVPVVCNNLPVLREVLAVNSGDCAVFADACDTPAFAEAVVKVLTDRHLRARLTEQSRHLQERYSCDTMVNAYERLIHAGLTP